MANVSKVCCACRRLFSRTEFFLRADRRNVHSECKRCAAARRRRDRKRRRIAEAAALLNGFGLARRPGRDMSETWKAAVRSFGGRRRAAATIAQAFLETIDHGSTTKKLQAIRAYNRLRVLAAFRTVEF